MIGGDSRKEVLPLELEGHLPEHEEDQPGESAAGAADTGAARQRSGADSRAGERSDREDAGSQDMSARSGKKNR
jgi:hypothetical protein